MAERNPESLRQFRAALAGIARRPDLDADDRDHLARQPARRAGDQPAPAPSVRFGLAAVRASGAPRPSSGPNSRRRLVGAISALRRGLAIGLAFGVARARGHGALRAFSPDGTLIVTASSDGTARIWDAAAGKEIAVLRGHKMTAESADRHNQAEPNALTPRSAADKPASC
jgi:hypothetical protein